MLIGGKDPKAMSRIHLLVLPRGDGESIVFKAEGIPGTDEFDKLCPEPQPPVSMGPGGQQQDKTNDNYILMMEQHHKKRLAYMTVHSLRPSDILWDRVKLDDPKTWVLWEDELREAGLNEVELGRVMTLVMVANALDESKLEEARLSFVAGQQAAQKDSSGPSIDPNATPSGAPVSD